MKNHVLSALTIGGLLASSLTFMPAHAAVQDIVQVSQEQRQADAQIILNEINKYRASKGVAPVKYSAQLSGIVQKESDRQIIEESVYHTNNFINDPAAGSWNSVNEVIALSYGRDVRELVKWWISSPPHEQAIRDARHEVIGIGITYADGSLANTGAPWQVLATVNLYGYNDGNEPADTLTSVSTVSTHQVSVAPTPTTYAVKGGIGRKYHQLGGASVLGTPVSAEQCGLAGGGCLQEFSLAGKKHIIMWSPRSYSHWIKYNGAIGQRWAKAGRELGYGYPTTDEVVTASEVYQRFSNGYTVHWAPGRGTWVTR